MNIFCITTDLIWCSMNYMNWFCQVEKTWALGAWRSWGTWPRTTTLPSFFEIEQIVVCWRHLSTASSHFDITKHVDEGLFYFRIWFGALTVGSDLNRFIFLVSTGLRTRCRSLFFEGGFSSRKKSTQLKLLCCFFSIFCTIFWKQDNERPELDAEHLLHQTQACSKIVKTTCQYI